MAEFKTLVLSRRAAGVAWLSMSRPAVFNAFDETMIQELDNAFAQLSNDPTVRVIVLAGEGKHFSAGADLQWMQRASAASNEWNLADARGFAAMLARIDACPKPTIARVQGAALGGGVGLVCACDVAIASENATFTLSESRLGLVPAVIGPYLVNAIGQRQARRLALTAARLGAAEALAIGLVHQVTAPGAPNAPNTPNACVALDAAVDALISDLLQGGPNAQREIKQLFAELEPGPVTASVRELTVTTISRVRASDEARAGLAAFLAKTPPPWQGP